MTMPSGLLEKYPNPIFIETGSSIAGCCERLINNKKFKELHGVELDKIKHQQCKARFGSVSKYHMYCGSSADILPKILEKINESTTIWLDAHPYNDILTVNDAPILQELQAILNHSKRIKVTVLIDDISLFAEPDRKQVLELASKIGTLTFIDTTQGKNDIAIING